MIYLTLEDAISVADRMGLVVRDRGILAGALARSQSSAFGRDVYPELPGKLAALIKSINRNHPLVDGNKRLSWVCARLFACANGWELRVGPVAGDKAIRSVASGDMSLADLTQWISSRLTRA